MRPKTSPTSSRERLVEGEVSGESSSGYGPSETARGGHGDRVACSHTGFREGNQRAEVPGTGRRREQDAHHAT